MGESDSAKLREKHPRLPKLAMPDFSQSPARESLGFLLARSAHQLRSRLEEELSPIGLHIKQFGVLMSINHFGALSQQQLGGALCIDRSTMVALIDELEQREIVQRHPDPEDRRAHRIDLTELGSELVRQASELADRVEDECLANLSDSERIQLKKLLRRIANLDGATGFEQIPIKPSPRVIESSSRDGSSEE